MNTEIISAIGSAVAALGTVVAVMVALAALRTSRRTAFTDQFLSAVGDMLAALAQVSKQASELNSIYDGESVSRQQLGDTFGNFSSASERIGLLEPVLSKNPEYGEWVRGVANNLAVNLLQADEFGPLLREMAIEEPLADEILEGATPPERTLLTKSLSFRSATMIGLNPPDEVPKAFRLPVAWWAERVIKYGGDDDRSVYSTDATYLTQNGRLLDDFVREYVHPWAQDLVQKGLR